MLLCRAGRPLHSAAHDSGRAHITEGMCEVTPVSVMSAAAGRCGNQRGGNDRMPHAQAKLNERHGIQPRHGMCHECMSGDNNSGVYNTLRSSACCRRSPGPGVSRFHDDCNHGARIWPQLSLLLHAVLRQLRYGCRAVFRHPAGGRASLLCPVSNMYGVQSLQDLSLATHRDFIRHACLKKMDGCPEVAAASEHVYMTDRAMTGQRNVAPGLSILPSLWGQAGDDLCSSMQLTSALTAASASTQ